MGMRLRATVCADYKPWNFRFLYVTVSTLNPIAGEGERGRREEGGERENNSYRQT